MIVLSRVGTTRPGMLRGWVPLVAHTLVAHTLVVLALATIGPGALASRVRPMNGWRDGGDAAVHARSRHARTTLVHARVESLLGRYATAIAVAQDVVVVAAEIGDPALEAAALLVRGQNEERRGALGAAEATLRRAADRANLAAVHRTRAEALVHLVFIVGDGKDEARRTEALALAGEAAAILRVSAADPVLQAQLDHNVAIVAKRGGDLDGARSHAERALAGFEASLGREHASTLRALVNLGNVLRAQGQLAEAEACLRRAADGLERRFDGRHPLVAAALANLAITIAQQKRPADAVPVFRRSLAIREANDPGHPDVAKAHYNLANALLASGAASDALAHYERGLELRRRAGASEDSLAEYTAAIARARSAGARAAGVAG